MGVSRTERDILLRMQPPAEFHSVDKSAWGPGAWQDEPDKLLFVDYASALPCAIVRNQFGSLCGYVGIWPDHPWYGKSMTACFDGSEMDYSKEVDYNLTIDATIDAHGGLTFAGAGQGEDEEVNIGWPSLEEAFEEKLYWFGFDCGHAWDLQPGMLNDLPFLRGVLAGEYVVYRNVGYVQGVLAKMARQIAAAGATLLAERENAGPDWPAPFSSEG